MAGEAVGLALEERRAPAGTRRRHRGCRGVAHREGVHPVDDLRRHAVGLRALGDVGHARDPGVRRRSTVEVVLADEDDRQLLDRGEVEPLVEGTLVGRALAEEADRDLVGSPQLHRQAESGHHGVAPTHDRDRGQHPDRGVAEVHRSALPPAAAGRLSVQLRHRRAGADPLCERVAVGPVRRGDPVVAPEHVAHPGGDGLLALVLMERAGDLPVEEEAVDPVLEAADEEDEAIEPEGIGV